MENEKSAPPDARNSTVRAFSNPSSCPEAKQGGILESPRWRPVVASAGSPSLDFDGLHCNRDGGRPASYIQGDGSSHESGSAIVTANSGKLLESQETVAGLLYKWVNLGKGWRPRWFVLEQGILSYYKVHGPNKITLTDEEHQISRIVGDESQKLMRKQVNIQRPRKAYGEVHLQVSSIRKSSSDDKKLYIFTGTKTLHLRAESSEDRNAWMDALVAAKNFLPRRFTKQVIVPPIKIVLSMERLRQRLSEEGLTEDVILDCEAIMQAEFSLLEKHVMALEQSHCNLIERLEQLEAEKLELEATVLDETKVWENATFNGHGQEVSEPETDDERDLPAGVEPESDEDDNVFFDTNEFLVSESISRSNSMSQLDLTTPPKEQSGLISTECDCPTVNMEAMDVEYPLIERRRKLPEPKENEKSVSLWSIIKDNIGKDLTKICLPVYFNEPISSLQKCFEDLEYSYLLNRASAWGMQGNSLMQILNVAAFAVSGYSSTEGRICKPFNPLLGETYEADYPDKGLRFFSEKVSHHPMTVACHCEGRGWIFWGDSTVKSKFWGRSIQLDPVGLLTLKFADGRTFQWSKVTTSIYNLILGKLYCDHYGTMHIQGNTEFSCKIKFKEQSFVERNSHQVQGFVCDKSGKKLATLFGNWDKAVYYVLGDIAAKSKNFDPMSEAVLLWSCNDPPEFQTRYNLTAFAVTLNEILPGLKEMLPPTDSRLRPDQRHLENGEHDLANMEKLRLEENQRQAKKWQEKGWQPRWFRKNDETSTFEYTGGYWEAREEKNWEGCLDIFGIHGSVSQK